MIRILDRLILFSCFSLVFLVSVALLRRLEPKFKVGDCVSVHLGDGERWETQLLEFMIVEIGKNKYRMAVYRPQYSYYYILAERSASMSIDFVDNHEQKIKCRDIPVMENVNGVLRDAN